MTGDFLAAFTRATPGDMFLTKIFQQNWSKNSPSDHIRFENFLLSQLDREVIFKDIQLSIDSFQFLNLTIMSEHLNFLRSDHSRFWVANNKDYFASLPAILLTDTGSYSCICSYVPYMLARSLQGSHEDLLPCTM